MSDYAVIRADVTIAIHDNLADAVAAWRPQRAAGARITLLTSDGKVYAAVIGDMRVRTRGRPGARAAWVRTVPIGWTRLVPPQRSEYAFGLDSDEKRSLFPGKTPIGRRTEAERRTRAARKRKRRAGA